MADKRQMRSFSFVDTFSNVAEAAPESGRRTARGSAGDRQRQIRETREEVRSKLPEQAGVLTGRKRKEDIPTDGSYWSHSMDLVTSCTFNKDRYLRMRRCAASEGMTIKSFMDRMLAVAFREYEKDPSVIRSIYETQQQGHGK